MSVKIDSFGVGLGLFAFGAGVLHFSELFGFIPDVRWGTPLVLTSVGISFLFSAVSRN